MAAPSPGEEGAEISSMLQEKNDAWVILTVTYKFIKKMSMSGWQSKRDRGMRN